MHQLLDKDIMSEITLHEYSRALMSCKLNVKETYEKIHNLPCMSINIGTLEVNVRHVLTPLHHIYTCNHTHCYSSPIVALLPRSCAWAEKRESGTHCA